MKDYLKLEVKIDDLERELYRLPQGSVTVKKIKGKDYFYHRVMKDGKRVENYIPFEKVEELKEQIELRKKLEGILKELYLKKTREDASFWVMEANPLPYQKYRTVVRNQNELKMQIQSVVRYRFRTCFDALKEYVFGPCDEKVFILYGLRRTGKTTLIRQVLSEMPAAMFIKAAYMQIHTGNTLNDVYEDLRLLEKEGYKYVFIDEVTLLDDFIEGAALFADIFATSGMKIVLSGTDSLGLYLAKEDQLYDRCIFLHTTFIPYFEFEKVLGVKGIDEYIRYGGTMSLGGLIYNESVPFSSKEKATEYVDISIARNIQHSLKQYQYGTHFRQLYDLYAANELTNVINRVVENLNHSFTREVVERTFYSHDLAVLSTNLLKDRTSPFNLKEAVDLNDISTKIKDVLEILDKQQQNVEVQKEHLYQIREYLLLLDLITEIELRSFPLTEQRRTMTVFSQPGLRYAQAKAVLESVLSSSEFQLLNVQLRQNIQMRLMNEIQGRMMEEIVLLETRKAHPEKEVFKLQFSDGEFDMVVYDKEKLNCRIYEVKYNRERVLNQARHLQNEEKCAMTENCYGPILSKTVIYRGESVYDTEIQYLNVEEYLKSLYE